MRKSSATLRTDHNNVTSILGDEFNQRFRRTSVVKSMMDHKALSLDGLYHGIELGLEARTRFFRKTDSAGFQHVQNGQSSLCVFRELHGIFQRIQGRI